MHRAIRAVRRHLVAVAGCIAIVGGVAFATAGPAAAAPSATVSATTTQGMAGPSLGFFQHRTFSRGKVLTLRCYERGQAVRGYYSPWVPGGTSDIWYQTVGDGGVWVPDIDINTGSNNPVAGRCPANLPWTEGASYRISQSPGGAASHTNGYNRYAIDVAMASGTVLRAAETGTVAFAGWDSGGGGNVIMVRRDGTDDCIQMAHQSRFNVSSGQRVLRGQVIGWSGNSGNATGPHLHFGVVSCSNWLSRYVLTTQENGTTYATGSYSTSWNAR